MAEVVYTVGTLPWQIVVADGVGVVGVPTVGVTVTVVEAEAGSRLSVMAVASDRR